MKNFNKMTEMSMSKANGGLLGQVMAVCSLFGTAAGITGGITVATNNQMKNR